MANNNDDLVFRLRKRAKIRRQITTRKSVQENKPDRLADLLDEAAGRIADLEEALCVIYRGLDDAGEDPYVYGETTVRDLIVDTLPRAREWYSKADGHGLQGVWGADLPTTYTVDGREVSKVELQELIDAESRSKLEPKD